MARGRVTPNAALVWSDLFLGGRLGIAADQRLGDWTLRLAWTNVVLRPSFGQLAPGFVIDADEASFGNPELKPLTSANLDIGVEHGLGWACAFSVYAFHTRIRNFIDQTDLAGSGRRIDFDAAVTLANGDNARVFGLELAHTKAFRTLPAPWSGIVLSGNATVSTSMAASGGFDVDAGATLIRGTPLPSQSSRLLNLVLGYETDAFSVRLAANNKSRYLLEVGDATDASRDLYVDAQVQLDLSARYSISRQFSLVFEAQNLANSPWSVFTGTPSHNAQFETYGRAYCMGLTFALF
jgi:TonB-dependent receptor